MREHLLDHFGELAGLRTAVGRGVGGPVRVEGEGKRGGMTRASAHFQSDGCGARAGRTRTWAASALRASISAVILATSASPFFSILSSAMVGVRARSRGRAQI